MRMNFAKWSALVPGVVLAAVVVSPLNLQASIIPISADTEIETNSTNPSDTYGTGNSGATVDMYAGYAGFNAPFKILLRFDLSSIPADQVITSATLHLKPAGGNGAMNADLHRLLVSWVEGDGTYGAGGTGTAGATWFSRDKSGSNAWTTPGAGSNGNDRDAGAISFVTSPSTDPAVNVTSDVVLWYASPATNFGWVLETPDPNVGAPYIRYNTHENGVSSLDPYLEVTFTPVPEPASAGLLLLASATLLRRCRA